jgi:DNA repair protein RecO (recombination protein O)
MRSFKTEAIVIKKRNFMEKDRVLTLFSRQEGKIDVLVKGARRPGSRLSYISDIGSICNFYIYKGKSLDILTEAQPIYLPSGVMGEFDKTNKLGFIFKILNKVYHEGDPHPATFEATKTLVKSIDSKELNLALPIFLSSIIADLGIAPSFSHCVACENEICHQEEICFERGRGVGHSKCVDSACVISPNGLKLLKILFSHTVDFCIKIKTDQKVIKEVYVFLQDYFEWEFGRLLPDEMV